MTEYHPVSTETLLRMIEEKLRSGPEQREKVVEYAKCYIRDCTRNIRRPHPQDFAGLDYAYVRLKELDYDLAVMLEFCMLTCGFQPRESKFENRVFPQFETEHLPVQINQPEPVIVEKPEDPPKPKLGWWERICRWGS